MDEHPTDEQKLRVALSEAYQASGLTLQDLIDRSGLQLTIVSLSRKLRGNQVLRLDEAQKLAAALGLSLSLSASSDATAALEAGGGEAVNSGGAL